MSPLAKAGLKAMAEKSAAAATVAGAAIGVVAKINQRLLNDVIMVQPAAWQCRRLA
jgi:hypothetical protein